MKICIITHHQVINNPRLYREADALAGAGHAVRVIAVRQTPEDSILDQNLAEQSRWRLQTINIEKKGSGYADWLRTGLRYKAAKRIWSLGGGGKRLAGYAYTRTFSETIGRVLSEPTDLIIAHTQPMLAPAYFAAQRLGIPWGFDCEDILSEEYGEGTGDPSHQRLVRYVEKTFMREAAYVTAASPLYLPWLEQHCGVKNPVLVRNLPSLADMPEAPVPGFPEKRKHLSLHWFSQSVGPERGIEDILRATAQARFPLELHLRGTLLASYRQKFERLINMLALERRVFVHARVAPGQVIRKASEHDMGLALMQACSVNHEMAVPNKLYFYMAAGLAVAATRTPGQQAALSGLPAMGFMYTPGDPEDLRRQLTRVYEHPELLGQWRSQAFQLARTQLNWEREKETLIRTVEKVAAT